MSPRLHLALRQALAAYSLVDDDIRDTAADADDYQALTVAVDVDDYQVLAVAMAALRDAYAEEPTVREKAS